MSKKDTEILIRDTEAGVELLIGKRVIGQIQENEGNFEAFAGDKLLAIFKTYPAAEEEVIRHYNLGH